MASAPKQAHWVLAEVSLVASESTAFWNEMEVVATVRTAGLLAARRASDVLPHAVDAEVEAVEIEFYPDSTSITIAVKIDAVAREQIFSRALYAASVCAVTMVDLAPNDLNLVIGRNRVVDHGGGRLDKHYSFDPPLHAAILTVSDAVFLGTKEDRTGELVRTHLNHFIPMGVELTSSESVPDEVGTIATRVSELAASGFELILVVGGTGLTDDDRTIEAVSPLLDVPIPGLGEAMRTFGQERTPRAFVSRSACGLIEDSLVVTLPGTRAGADEALQALGPAILHVPYVRRRMRS